jgi:hypothetical protein
MSVPHVQKHENAFVERNLFLHALLGLISFGNRFETFVKTTASELDCPLSEEPVAHRDVYLLLGALSICRRIRSELALWCEEPREPSADGLAGNAKSAQMCAITLASAAASFPRKSLLR